MNSNKPRCGVPAILRQDEPTMRSFVTGVIATLMLAPATGFYGTAGLGKNEVRLAYVLNLDSLNKAMDCLEKALEVYPGKVATEKIAAAAAK